MTIDYSKEEVIPKHKKIARLFFIHPCNWYIAYNENGEDIGKIRYGSIHKLRPYFIHPDIPCIDYRDSHSNNESLQEMRKEVDDYILTGIVGPNAKHIWLKKTIE